MYLTLLTLSFYLTQATFAATGTVPNDPYTDHSQSIAAAQASAASAASASDAAASSAAATLIYQNTAGISSGNSNISLPDPCGPPIQAPGLMNSVSTCHLNVSVANITEPQAYGVQCLHDNTTYILDKNACFDAMDLMCDALCGFHAPPPRDQWVWSNQTGNCTFGFWLPTGGAPPPSYDRCTAQITAAMVDACVAPAYNVAAVNLKELPSATFNETTGQVEGGSGVPVDGGYLSFIMVAQGGGPGSSTPKSSDSK
ncbi:hypothetical protein P7C71_g3630, partial [Lecanoromycetidae sp. Uapishka_2]